jgi:hypothetical protein
VPKNWLVRHQHEMPVMGMGTGKKPWWIGQFFHQGIMEKGAQLHKELLPGRSGGGTQGLVDEEFELKVRILAANLVQKEWHEELSMKVLTGAIDKDSENKKARGRSWWIWLAPMSAQGCSTTRSAWRWSWTVGPRSMSLERCWRRLLQSRCFTQRVVPSWSGLVERTTLAATPLCSHL